VTFPQKVIAGDFVQWRIPASQDVFGNSISSPDWSVVYYLRTNTSSEGATVNSSAYNDGFQFSIPAATTANFDAGNWFYQAVANKSGQETQTIYRGSFEVFATQSYSGTPAAYDGRSQVEKDLDVIQAAIRTIISGGAIQEYKIGTRTAKKYELSELIMLEARYKAELVREKQAEMIANGLGNPRATFVRFNEAY
jgi:hypothetical protein|tara:strand:- start:1457 stop:2041 length:585 start_codon:yes stop_codon:yes gene_type:complete